MIMEQERQQQEQEERELELRYVLDRVLHGMGGESEVIVLASALGLRSPTDNKLGDTDEVIC